MRYSRSGFRRPSNSRISGSPGKTETYVALWRRCARVATTDCAERALGLLRNFSVEDPTHEETLMHARLLATDDHPGPQ
jgi:hypothetical protein